VNSLKENSERIIFVRSLFSNLCLVDLFRIGENHMKIGQYRMLILLITVFLPKDGLRVPILMV
jgi:hypothetical protein